MSNPRKISKRDKRKLKLIKNDFSNEDLVITEGVDTYVNIGNKVNSLSVQTEKRNAFFKNHPNAQILLENEEANPLVEEGRYTENKRDHEGESYLTYQAITLWIEKNIRQHRNNIHSLAYNKNNIFVVKNDPQQLTAILERLSLKPNEDAKLIYITGIHTVPFYLRNCNHQIKCFIVDSEAGAYGLPDEIIESVKTAFNNAILYLSSTILQRDYYSCSTFSLKALRYFVKHGTEIFPYIDALNLKADDHRVYKTLPANKLMPALLKMCQSMVDVPEASLNTIVSHKSQTTLRDYWKAHQYTAGGKVYNSAALKKKYKYLNSLDKQIKKYGGMKENAFLPDALLYQHLHYSEVKASTVPVSKPHYIDKLIALAAYFDANEKSHLPDDCLAEVSKITSLNLDFSKQYLKYFNNSGTKLTDVKKVKSDKLFLIANALEAPLHKVEYLQYSDKLCQVFENIDQIITYLKTNIVANAKQPLHDACLFSLPAAIDGEWNKTLWANLLLKYGNRAAKFLNLAPQIETLLRSNAAETKLENVDLETIKSIAKSVSYKRAHENPELAELCLTFKRSEKQFNQCLAYLEQGLKPFDLLPDIEIKGSALGSKYTKFTFKKLAINDLRGFFLGEYSACCQSIGKAGEACAVDGMTSTNSGFYVIEDESGKILLQSWAWVGLNGELVFDSIEHINKNQDYICQPFLLKAADEMLKYGFKRIIVGEGGNTPEMKLASNKELAKQRGAKYSDASMQQILKQTASLSTTESLKAYCEKFELNFEDYANLFENDSISASITHLILQDKLSLNNFIKLLQFLYLTGHFLLHPAQDKSFELISACFKKYGYSSFQLLLTQNHEGNCVLSHVVKNNHHQFMQTLLALFSEYKISNKIIQYKLLLPSMNLLHYSVATNSEEIFHMLLPYFKTSLTWQESLVEPNTQHNTIFHSAFKSNNSQTYFDILLREATKETIEMASKKTNEHGKSLHDLIIESDHAKEIVANMGNHYAINSTTNQPASENLYTQFYTHSKLIFAIRNKKKNFILFLLKNAPSKTHLNRFVNGEVFAAAAQIDFVEFFEAIYMFSPNDQVWEAIMLTVKDNTDRIALHSAVRCGAVKCTKYILDSVNDITVIHKFLVVEDKTNTTPLESRNSSADGKYYADLISRILTLYANTPDKLFELLNRKDFVILQTIANSTPIEIFEKIISLLASHGLLEKIFPSDEDKFYDSLIGNILCVEDKSKIPLAIEVLLKFSTLETKRKFFMLLPFLIRHHAFTKDSLQVVLLELDAINDTTFTLSLLEKDRENAKDNELMSCALAFESRDSVGSGIFFTLLDYYFLKLGKERTEQIIKSEVWNLAYLICSRNNIYVLPYIYSLHKNCMAFLKRLYSNAISDNRKVILNWLLDNDSTYTNKELLDLYMKRILPTVCNHSGYNFTNIETLNILWTFITKSMTPNEVNEIIASHFRKIIEAIKSFKTAPGYTRDNVYGVREIAAKTVLFNWLKQSQYQYDHFDILCKTAFELAWENEETDIIYSIMLLNPKPEIRTQLVDEMKLKYSDRPGNLLITEKIETMLTTCQYYDRLCTLNNLLADHPLNTTTQLQFFCDTADDSRLKKIIALSADFHAIPLVTDAMIKETYEKIMNFIKSFENRNRHELINTCCEAMLVLAENRNHHTDREQKASIGPGKK